MIHRKSHSRSWPHVPCIVLESVFLQRAKTVAITLFAALVLAGCIESDHEPNDSELMNCSSEAVPSNSPDIPYTAAPESLATHELPAWFDDAKLGIMIHWGLYSVPGWAETTLDPADWNTPESLINNSPLWYMRNPYAEWYANTIQVEGSEAQAFHHSEYGPDFAYDLFRAEFEEKSAQWNPQDWADLFAQSGARYVVLVTKHHDGYLLWPSDIAHPYRSNWASNRDIVGELSQAVRSRCMRMGLYYSGGIDWSFEPKVIKNLDDFIFGSPEQPEYATYADAHWRELIEKYRPAVIWNDIRYPEAALPLELFASYYNAIPEGVINDRWSSLVPGAIHNDFISEEYRSRPEISPRKFETIRGIGRSFGYNRNEDLDDYLDLEELVFLFVDIVSKNGNLVLNVGPRADGTIPAEQVERLEELGRWLQMTGQAYFGSIPWIRAEGSTREGNEVRFTRSKNNGTLYATVFGSLPHAVIGIENMMGEPTDIDLLGGHPGLSWYREGDTLIIVLPDDLPKQPAYTFAILGL